MSTIKTPDVAPSFQLGDFERIYQEFAPVVYRTSWGVLLNRADAEDVLQTIFVRLLRNGFPPEFHKNPKAYLHRASLNASLDVLRARRRHPEECLGNAASISGEHSHAQSRFDEEQHERVLSALAQLPPTATEVLILHYMHKKRTAEIAMSLGVSRTVVTVRLFRARTQLRKLLRLSEEKTDEKP